MQSCLGRFLCESNHRLQVHDCLIVAASAACGASRPGTRGLWAVRASTGAPRRDCPSSGVQQRGNRQKPREKHRRPFEPVFPLSACLAVICKNAEEAGTSVQSHTAAPCTLARVPCTLPTALSHSLILILANLNAWIYKTGM